MIHRRPPEPGVERIIESEPPAVVPVADTTAASPAETVAPPTSPADPRPVPAPGPEGEFDLKDPNLYLNRELTWLGYNHRVLHEAQDDRTPLLERIKFISIVSSNLDEFFLKRIGGLKQQVAANVLDLSLDGRSPAEQIALCYEEVRRLQRMTRDTFGEVTAELEVHGVRLLTWPDLGPDDRTYIRDYYFKNVYPLVTPQATDSAHPFPFISNLSLNLLVTLRYRGDQEVSLARVKMPVGAGVPRLLQIPGRDAFVTVESVMAGNLDLLFPEMEVLSCELFRVTRNADTVRDPEGAEDLLAQIESGLRERRFAPVVRLEVSSGMSPYHRDMLAVELGLDAEQDVFEEEGMLGLVDVMEFLNLERPELKDPPHHPVDHPLMHAHGSLFQTIREAGSILVHHPYESYVTSVDRLLKEASQDPDVRAIKMTLYRTSAESKTLDYLIEAARNGKQVAVVVELQASFEEAANIRWANRLGEAGIHATYGVMGLKTHCKALLVVREEADGLRRYAHIGTGNYHSETARLYVDLGLFTCDEAIGQDLTELFNYLTTGYKPKRNYKKILPAPKILRRALLDKINREIELAGRGELGHIQMKINALEDRRVTAALYRASQAGVKVDLIVRDTCRLRPGIPGLSENIRVLSIVGRFLEHSRIYYFRAGGAEEYYIGSADAMYRSLNNRVELIAPVEAPPLRSYLRHILGRMLDDQRAAWEMRPDGSYVQRVPAKKSQRKSAQESFAERAARRLKEATRLKRRKPRTASG